MLFKSDSRLWRVLTCYVQKNLFLEFRTLTCWSWNSGCRMEATVLLHPQGVRQGLEAL